VPCLLGESKTSSFVTCSSVLKPGMDPNARRGPHLRPLRGRGGTLDAEQPALRWPGERVAAVATDEGQPVMLPHVLGAVS
jgi:hypothetical protein